MTATQTLPKAESAYLRRLDIALHALPQPDRVSIIAEIESHIAERLSEGAKLEMVLERLGPADALGQSFLEDQELSRVLSKGSPGALLVNILGRATRSITALVCGAVAVALYALGIVFSAIAVLKPVFSAHVGFWVAPGDVALGVSRGVPLGHEILGYWIIPLSVMAAVLCYILATGLLKFCGRLMLRRSGRV
jgi:uncharacterized membrane protein